MGVAFNGLRRKIMKRNVKALTEKEFDLIVVGAGIYGAAIAWDASLRGLSVALVERGDFGSGTSSNSLKIVHGGLRYLQQLDVKRVRESVRERRIMLTIAPHLVQPLPSILPCYGHLIKGPEVMFCGMLLNDILSFDRNRGVDPLRTIPNCRVVNRKSCLYILPGIDSSNVTGGAVWTDAQMYSSERLLLAFVKSASFKGAVTANYVKAESLIIKNSKAVGVKAIDLVDNEELEIRGKVVVNSSGAWINSILPEEKQSSSMFKLSTAMNLVLSRNLFPEIAAGIYGHYRYDVPGRGTKSGRRVLFATPWRGRTIIGTFHRPYKKEHASLSVNREEVESFLKEVNSAVPAADIKPEDVTFVQKGFLPMDGISRNTGEVLLTKHYRITDHKKRDRIDGLLSVVGVKYTTARDVAEKMVNLVTGKLGKKALKSVSKTTKLYGGDISSFDNFEKEVVRNTPDNIPGEVSKHLGLSYGTEYKSIFEIHEQTKGGLVPGSKEVLEAEIIFAVREEAAQKLSDVILRRTDLGSMGHPGKEALNRCADIMAKELNWPENRKQNEIDEVDKIYTQWS